MNNYNTIILVTTPPIKYSYRRKGYVYPFTSILYIGTILKKKGYNIKVIDGWYDKNYIDHLRQFVIDNKNKIIYVGFSVMTVCVPSSLKASIEVKKIKKELKVVWGGAHPILFPEQTLKNHAVDIAITNEGLLTAVNLAKHIQKKEDLSSIRGIGYKSASGKINITPPAQLDEIKDYRKIDFSIIDLKKYTYPDTSLYQREFPGFKKKIKPIVMLTGLGCPYRCNFCINSILKRKYRSKRATEIVKEIKESINNYDVNTFLFMDEDFFINKRRLMKFLNLLEKENLHFNWRFWCRVDQINNNKINSAFLERMENIGHGSLVMGAESGNNLILKSLNKGITVDQILNSLSELKDFTKITPRYSFMVGLENESINQMKDTFHLINKMRDIRSDIDVAIFIFRLYPGSSIYTELIKKYQIIIPNSLNEWGSYMKENEAFIEMEWTPKLFQKSLKYIRFYLNFYSRKTSEIKHKIYKKFFINVIISLSRFRITNFIFTFPVEYWLVNLLRRIKSKKV